jgi:hypothetical protein
MLNRFSQSSGTYQHLGEQLRLICSTLHLKFPILEASMVVPFPTVMLSEPSLMSRRPLSLLQLWHEAPLSPIQMLSENSEPYDIKLKTASATPVLTFPPIFRQVQFEANRLCMPCLLTVCTEERKADSINWPINPSWICIGKPCDQFYHSCDISL